MKRTYIQLYSYEQDGSELLQKNIFTEDLKLVMQTYIYDGSMEPNQDLLLFELDYPVQSDKFLSLKRSLDKHFASLKEAGDDSRILLIEDDNKSERRGAEEGLDPLFERLYDKFTRIVSYSSIPSG